MKIIEVPGGIVVHGAFPDQEVLTFIAERAGPLPLIIADPPYGNILPEGWDQTDSDDKTFAEWMISWTYACEGLSLPGAALYVWGGIGTPSFRPFYRYLIEVERRTKYQMSSHITWAKKRAYGIQWGYLFCREELGYFVLGDIREPRLFNVPLLEKKRGYEGYDKKHPAKSEFLRRTNVWMDITEMLRGKKNKAQKPEKLHEIMIEVHTKPGEWVLDCFAGSGTTGRAARKLGRKFILVEKDKTELETCLSLLGA